MALESFYGGKPGVSPVIKARFKYIDKDDRAYRAKINSGPQQLTEEEANWLNDAFGTTKYTKDLWVRWVENNGTSLADVSISTINEQTPLNTSLAPFTMEECLKDINYTNVWYGELCIIDTDSKLNPNNGKIYRRTLKYGSSGASATGYAEYVGQIVGPSGGVPQFHIGSLDEERKKAVGAEPTYKGETISSNSNWQYSYISFIDDEYKFTSKTPDNFKKIAVLNANNENSANIQMVPGKETIKNNNTETIKYHDNIRYTWCNVRRKLDGDNTEDAWIYLGFEIPYTTFEVTGVGEEYTYIGDLVENTSSKPTDSEYHPFHKNYVFHIPRGTRGIGPEEIFIVGKDSKTKPDPLYDFDAIEYNSNNDNYFINTNKTKNPSEDTYWVAKWTLHNPKTTNKTTVYQYLGAYKDISNVILHHGQKGYNNDGTVEVCYSNGSSISFDQALTWITNATLDTDPKKIEIQDGQEVEVNNPDYGKFTLTFNNNKVSPITKNLRLIKDASYDDKTGQITFNYSGEVSETVGKIQYISKMKVDNSGHLLYKYNTDDQNPWNNIKDESNNDLRIKDIKEMQVTDYGQLQVQYRGETNWFNLGQTNNIVNTGPVCILENSDQNSVNGIFSTREKALNQLKASTYSDSTPYPKINGITGTIKIEINGEEIDASGGLVGVKVSNSNINENTTGENETTGGETTGGETTGGETTGGETNPINIDHSEDYYIALYWYDPNLSSNSDPNSTPKGWTYVGAIGSGIDQNYEVYISKKDEIVPNINVENAAIHFQAISTDNFVASGQQEAIGFLPWETVESKTSDGDNTSSGDETSDEDNTSDEDENSSGGENSGGEGSDENNTSDGGENSGGDENSGGENSGGDENGS